MKNYTVLIEYNSGYKHPLSSDDYKQASKWWEIFANQEAAKNCKIAILTMTDNHNKKTIASFCAKGTASKVA